MGKSLVFYISLVTVQYIHVTRDIKPSLKDSMSASVFKRCEKLIFPTKITKEEREWKRQEKEDLLSDFLMVRMVLGEI